MHLDGNWKLSIIVGINRQKNPISSASYRPRPMEQNSLEQKIQAKEIAEIFPLNFQLKIVVVLEQSRWKTWIFEPCQDANVVKTMAFSNPHVVVV